MKYFLVLLVFILSTILFAEAKSIHDFKMIDIDGNEVELSRYKGKVVMIVNVASKCGFTSQYEQLEEIYKEFDKDGFVILGFPSNDFMGQEPGTDEEIKNFCTLNYGVSFPMFSKIKVKGKDAHPLYKFLTDKKTNPDFGGKITWNFNKFLIGKDGSIIGRFSTRTKPNDEKVKAKLKAALH